jgi:hypothetical protein
MAAAAQKLEAMRGLTTRRTSIHLGMPDVRPSAGRCSPGSWRSPALHAGKRRG